MTKGNDVNKDFEKGMQSFAKQLKILQNNIKSLGVLASGVADTIGVDLISALNSALEKMREMANDTSKFGLLTNGLSDSVFTLTMALAGFVALKFPIVQMGKAVGGMASGLGGLFGLGALGSGALFAGVAILATGLLTAYSIHKRIVLQRQYELELQEELIRKTEAQIQANDALLNNIEAQKRILVDIANTDYTKNWDKAYDIISAVTEKSSELKAILEATEKIKAFKLPELKSYNEAYEESISNMKKDLELKEQNAMVEDKLYNKTMTRLKMEQKELENIIKYGSKRIDSDEDYMKKLEDWATKEAKWYSSYKTRGKKVYDLGDLSQLEEAKKAFKEFNQEVIEVSPDQFRLATDDVVENMLKKNNEARIKAREDLYRRLKKEDSDYAQVAAMNDLSQRKVDTEFYNESMRSLKNYYDVKIRLAKNPQVAEELRKQYKKQGKVVSEFINENVGKDILEALSGDAKKIKEFYENVLPDNYKDFLNKLNFANNVQQIQLENLQKINQEAIKLNSYYEQIATTVVGMEYEAFSDMLEKTSVSGVEQYTNLAESMGFTEVVKGIDMMKDRLSDVEMTKLIDDKNLLNAISETKGIEKAISNLQDSLKNEDAVKQFKKMKQEGSELFKAIDEAYKGNRDNAKEYVAFMTKKLNEILQIRLKAMLAVDPNLIKSAFYQDKAKLMELELLKVRQDGIQQMLTEQEILKENTKLRKEALDLQLRGLSESQLRETRKTMIAEKKALEGKKEAQLKGGLNLITSEDIKRSEILDKNIEAITQELEAINNEKIKEVELNNKIIEQINKISQDAKKLSDSFASINKKSMNFAQLIGVVGKDTENSLIQLAKRKQIEMDDLATSIKKLTLKKNLTAEEAKELSRSKERVKNGEKDVKNIKDRLKNVEELQKRQAKIDDNLKKAEDIRKKVANYGKNEYDLAVQRNKELDQEIEAMEQKLSGEKDSEKNAELQIKWRNLQLEKEQAITDEIQKRNNLINEAITGTGQIINLLSGADSVLGQNFGAISPMLGELFSGAGTFKNVFAGFQAFKSGGTYDTQGNLVMSQMAGLGSMLGGAGAIASMAMPIADAVFGSADKQNAKAEARFKKEYELSEKQLQALQNMSSSLKDYTDKVVEALVKMPTFQKLAEQQLKIEPVVESVLGQAPDLSDIFFKRKGGKDWRGKTQYKTKQLEIDEFLLGFAERTGMANAFETIEKKITQGGVDGFIKAIDIEALSIDDIKKLEKELSKVTDWNAWFTNVWGTAKATVETNASIIQSQLKEYIKAYDQTQRALEDLMKEATFGAMKGIEYTSVTQAKQEFEELGKSLLLEGNNLQMFVDEMMNNFEEITTTAGITIRDSIVNGVEQGLSETEILVNGFRGIFDQMASNINATITDIQFGKIYEDVEDATLEMANLLKDVKVVQDYLKNNKDGSGAIQDLKEWASIQKEIEKGNISYYSSWSLIMDEMGKKEIKHDYSLDFDTDKYIQKMLDAMKKSQELDEIMFDFNEEMREAMVLSGDFSDEFIEAMYPVKKEIQELIDEFDNLKGGLSSAIATALKTQDLTFAMSNMGSYLGDTFIDNFIESMLESQYDQRLVGLTDRLQSLMQGDFNMSSIQSMQTDINRALLEMQGLQNRALAVKDLLTIDMGDVEYESVNRSIQYETGSTQTINNYYNNNYYAQIGNMIADDASMELLMRRLKDFDR